MCIPFRNEGCPGGFKELGSSAPGCFCSCVFLQSIHFTVVNDRKRCDLFIDGMDLVKSFVPGRLDLSDLLKAFFLDLGPFLRALRRAKAIATGVQVALFMARALKRSVREHPRALVLDVLCHTTRARDILVGMLEAAGYSSRGSSLCCHDLGEWAQIPREKRVCMVQGNLSERAVHIVELCRSPVETVLSRSYGSMPGSYITGGARAVSLFPQLTFVDRRCWVPGSFSQQARGLVQRKYREWAIVPPGVNAGLEVDGAVRSVSDSLSWTMEFCPETGEQLPSSSDAGTESE